MKKPDNPRSPYTIWPDIEFIHVRTDDYEKRIVRLIAQLLIIDEALALDETCETEEKAA
jgi:hypothetical protein